MNKDLRVYIKFESEIDLIPIIQGRQDLFNKMYLGFSFKWLFIRVTYYNGK